MTYCEEHHTFMYKESQEAPQRVKQQLAANTSIIETLSEQLRSHVPLQVVTCARGSSDHAATFAKYLIETNIGILTTSMAPSISSVFNVKQNMEHTLFLAISQSGKSPDILMATQAAKNSGAIVVAIVNDTASPLAKISDFVIPMYAGPEKSIAATKSFICTLSALVHLVATWAQSHALVNELGKLPNMLTAAFAQDWSAGLGVLKPANNLFVVSRGLGFGVAQEAALKFKETCGLHAEAFSAAEVKHGPMTIVRENFPVFVFSVQDQTQPSIDNIATTFIHRSAQVLSVGAIYEKAFNLGTVSCAAPELRPLVFIQSFYKFVNSLAVERGYNPDKPLYLNKITETV